MPYARAAELGIATGRAARADAWLARLVGYYLERRSARPRRAGAEDELTARERAHRAQRRACVRSALSGAAAASVSTATAFAASATEGVAAIVGVPLSLAAIAGDVAYRSAVHVDLACEIAEAFGEPFDASNPDDILRISALVFQKREGSSVLADRERLAAVESLGAPEIAERLGRLVVGESLARNALPVVGIAASAVTSWIVTRKLGETLRRTMRYQRALDDALERSTDACKAHLGLLVEGMWFLFTADGCLSPEATMTLARLLARLPERERLAVEARFVEDELEWAERIEALPEEARDDFMSALYVAATVEKRVGVPERKILRRAAHHLGRTFDPSRVAQLIADFRASGVIADEHRRAWFGRR